MEAIDVAEKLLARVGTVVTIEFHDGEVVDACVRAVDIGEHDDVIYEVVRVRASGGEMNRAGLFRADVTEIASVSDPP